MAKPMTRWRSLECLGLPWASLRHLLHSGVSADPHSLPWSYVIIAYIECLVCRGLWCVDCIEKGEYCTNHMKAHVLCCTGQSTNPKSNHIVEDKWAKWAMCATLPTLKGSEIKASSSEYWPQTKGCKALCLSHFHVTWGDKKRNRLQVPGAY